MTRQEKRREQKKRVKALLESYHPTKIFDDDLGIAVEFLQGDCPNCGTEQTNFVLEKERDFYCVGCKVSKADSELMQRTIRDFEEAFRSQSDFPDETIGSMLPDTKSRHPEILEVIRLIADDSEGYEELNRIRHSKTYKAYPKSLSDEDRLFLTMFSWSITRQPIFRRVNIDNLTGDQLPRITFRYEIIRFFFCFEVKYFIFIVTSYQ
jgi:hypothetical protein